MTAVTKENKLKIFIACYIFMYFLWNMVFQDNSTLLHIGGDIFQTVAPLLTGYWCAKQYFRMEDKLRYFWLLASLASFSYAGGMILYRLNQTFYNPATGLYDVFWITSTLLYLAAIVYANSLNKGTSKIVQYVFDIIIVMVVASSISWHFIIQPLLLTSYSQGLLYTLVAVSYPIGNLMLLFAVLSLFYNQKSIFPKNIFILNILAFSILSFVNMMYLYLLLSNAYQPGSIYDLMWPFAILLLGLASFYNKEKLEQPFFLEEKIQSNRKILEFLSLRLILPYFSVIVIFIFMIFQSNLEINSIVIGAILSTLLIIIRQVFTLVQNNELIQEAHDLNRQLELKVNQRTKELYFKNQELKETIKKVEHIAYHDSLTSLTNRRYFEENVWQAIEEAHSSKKELAILFIDLDRFKFVNDTLGHSVGDVLLQKVAEILISSVGPKNIVSRQGGDEFMILLMETSKKETQSMAKKIVSRLENPLHINGNELFITSSIGISMYPDNGTEVDTLIKRADTAMYSAKEQGKNRYQFFDAGMDEKLTTKVNLENGLRRAIELDELSVFYQPKIELESNKVVGTEALLRWKHSRLGYIAPSVFIPLAEETGLIVKLGDWVLRQACLQLKDWQERGLHSFSVSVNVSTIQFLQKDFVEKVHAVINETAIEPCYLELEITESTMMDTKEVAPILQRLQRLGIKISVDDFGSGYSSLSHIKNLPIDSLKIDKTFIEELDSEISDVAIVSTIITLAKNLNLKVVAEGVENEKQYKILKEKGCDEVQGYYLSKPQPVSEFNRCIVDGEYMLFTAISQSTPN